MFNIVLVEPEIPPNTGNIARLCAATGSTLYLVGKLGFSIDDKHLKRAGLDYWDEVKVERVDTLDELIGKHTICCANESRAPEFYYLSTKVKTPYTDVHYKKGDFLVFGKETKGLPEQLLKDNPETAITIPMWGAVRSLNLATSAGIVLYEAIRQVGAPK
ncbi:MAG: tRNA (cytidine(34)-2'-O)-methyltransferase [Candidatus Margulisiibacteriota bacterium]